ncbi:MAG: NAD(P)/FAD-dependent oxidoreductase [Acidobacteria bacterium]|nr:NAD(P)/FAD-dependent oxidoreductase [Acidobacteriota bacterium]
MPAAQNIAIIGGGHNALVTAFYLARAGHKPVVLERRGAVGGAAITDEFHSGFRCSTLAHTTGPLRPDVAREMQLEQFDLHMIYPEPRVFAPSPDGRALLLFSAPAKSAAEIAKFSAEDAENYVEFHNVLGRMAAVLSQAMMFTPPSIDHPSADDVWNLLKTGRGFRSLGKKDMFRLLRWGPMAVADLVSEWFETELLRATLAARGIFGTALGPWSAGSAAVFLVRAAADGDPAGPASFPRGGLGALTKAMAAAATRAGAEIRTGAEVAQILVKDGAVAGVVLSTGEEVAAKTVISGADPQRTFLKLMDPVHLEPDFLGKMQHYRSLGTTAKVNLALGGLPSFTALQGAAAGGWGANRAMMGRIHIGPEIDYLERAFDVSKYGDFSPHPYLDVTIPSLSDPSLAPPGKHVMSIYAQYAPFRLKHGAWPSQRAALGEAVVKTLAAYAPNLPELILDDVVITPHDLEETYGLTGGHIFHGELALDQLFTMRPLLDWARYRTPLRGLYLCGSGTHPGNGLTGASGANAAREILKDLR